MISAAVRDVIVKADKYPCITKIGIFGSRARNDYTESSDLDILIDYDKSSDIFLDNLDDFMDDIELAYNGKIDFVTIPGLMDSKDDFFKSNVLREVKWLYNATNT